MVDLSLIDFRRFQRTVMLEVATSPTSLIPFLGGASLLLGIFAFKAVAAAWLVVGLAGVVWGVVSAFYKVFFSKAVYNRISEAITKEEEFARQQEISFLRNELKGEASSLLEDILGLRDLLQSYNTESLTTGELTVASRSLLEQSILNLKRIPAIDKTMNISSGTKTRSLIKQQRDKLIRETKENVEFVAKVVADVQDLGTNNDDNQEQTRKELQERLEVAKQVDQRLSALNMNFSAMPMMNSVHVGR